MDWYKNWFGSPFYKILYQNRDELEAREFVENLRAYLQPPPGCAMLDIACGEGRFARQLAEHGFDVTGIDISHESIEVAKAFETDNLQFFMQDMRFPFYINYFDYAFNFFTSFGYFAHDQRANDGVARPQLGDGQSGVDQSELGNDGRLFRERTAGRRAGEWC